MSMRACWSAAGATTASRSKDRCGAYRAGRPRTEQGYELPHFAIDWEHEQVTCPQGKTSVSWRAARDEDGEPAHPRPSSAAPTAGPAPPGRLCTPAKDARRSVYFHPRAEYEALNAARARMHDPAWKERYHVRAGVEGTLSQGVRAFGMRRSRYIGLARPGFSRSASPPR